MKSLGIFITTLFVLGADGHIARAALRVPQVAFQGGILQGYLNALGESINVLTDQIDGQHWGGSISNNSSFTVQVELVGNADGNTFGIYNADSAPPAFFQLFPGAATNGWIALASFRTSPTRVVVNLFDNNGVFLGSTAYLGGDRNDFGYYVRGSNGTFYSQDFRNPNHEPHVLAYAATGVNSGSYWMAFEDTPGAALGHDFADAIFLVEGGPGPLVTAPVPVLRSSWGVLKQRFR